ncbi:MAG: hypothetical protein JAZ05_11085, partial [Candidatus Thiodiazotropha taylori]|nr:hypothetical protein [Candidatus Thiodiazotropha taylori]MCW4292560.1 hypothetical protein [Candidatus Thiodiazotropha taylori]
MNTTSRSINNETLSAEDPEQLEPVYTSQPICVALVASGRLGMADADRAVRLKESQQSDESIGNILLQLGLISDRDLAQALVEICGVPLVERKDYPDLAHLSENISANFLKQHRLVVFDDQEDHILAIMVDPSDRFVVEALELISGKSVKLLTGVASEIDETIQEHFNELQKSSSAEEGDGLEHQLLLDDVEQLKELASEAPVIKMVNQIIQRAVSSKASDIHIEPSEQVLTIRHR